GAHAVPGRHQAAGHHDEPDHRSGGLASLQHGRLRGRLRPRGHAGRRGGRRLEAGDDRAGLRAQRARALPGELRAPARADPRGLKRSGRARRGDRRPARRAPRDSPPDVALGGPHAPGRREPESRGGRREGRGHDVRAGSARSRPRAARRRTDDRLRKRSAAGARLLDAARPVVLAPRRHARDPARHHRARPGAQMNELRTILSDVVARLFTDRVTKELLESAETGAWPDALWQAVEENGLTWPLVPESKGGAGGTWSDAFVVARAAGRHAVPLPIVETIVGSWLLSESGLEVPSGPLTI